MSDGNRIADHYTHGSLAAAIRTGIEALGKTTGTITIDDLAPVDEFHIGGRQASEDFLGQLELSPDHHVLDVGSGLAGACRFVASRFGSHVTGIDLTPEFVETGEAMCRWVGLSDRIALHHGSALEMPFEDGRFDKAYMMHVGMNIPAKADLFSEVARVLRPGASFGVYDVMQTAGGDLTFPVPWATTTDTSALASPDGYRAALQAAGFDVTAERNRRDFALAFFADMKAKAAAAEGPPPLGLHILFGEDRAEKVKNMVENISAGRIAPVEMIAVRKA